MIDAHVVRAKRLWGLQQAGTLVSRDHDERKGQMKIPVAKRLAPAILALCIAGGSLGAAAGPAFASGSKSTAAKAGAACTKSEVGKTAKVGKETLVCKKSGSKYKWEKK
jgi:hypothetical protein